jgi:hypothetical protein
MRLRPPRRSLVVLSSSAESVRRHAVSLSERPVRTRRVRRFFRVGTLLIVIAVRPRWQPLLAGTALMVLGVVERHGWGGILVIPAMLLLWQALMISADEGAGRERLAQLRRELESYSTPAQRRDLDATLDRYPDGMTSEIRDLLARPPVPSASGIPGAARH